MWLEHVFLICIFSTSLISIDSATKSRVVQLAQGPVRGYKDPKTGIFMFYGIPYATAPAGLHKYKGPLPPPTWQQTFDAVDKGIVCPQLKGFLDMSEKIEQEDCLIANVYVPDTDDVDLPVLVSVHGGGFQLGFGEILTYKNFANSKNMIVVTFNYRVGVHGFLCLGTENIPGNAGMKDQVALLRWVKKNIGSFGGNPNEVTLIGSSAGSISVDLLMLSPSAKGLFSRVIPESGSSVGVFSVQLDPLQTAKNHARLLNFSDFEDVYALETFYLTASHDLLSSVTYMMELNSLVGFTPCVERPAGENVFIDDAPVNILKSGNYIKMPLLYGFTNMEGIFRMNLFHTWKDMMNENFAEFLPADLQFDNEEQKIAIAEIVKQYYFGSLPISDDNMFAYIDYFTDIVYGYPALRSVRLQLLAGNKNIYLYEYSFADVGGTPMGYKNYSTTRGASHAQQSVATADGKPFETTDESSLSEEFRKIKTLIREMWHNFIVNGKPVPERSSLLAWPPMGADWSPHMSLGNTVELKGSLLLERALFWEKIYEQHYRSPIPPPAPIPRRSEL